ncbi:helix-hairpin-helix domain-containing protein [Enterococcus durans]|uniref:helix-hairpin-helix domain-containing protein n=1 Tax=Enterococcus durans TaxID=53345 RepID=UPI0028925F19|nr:helix-hairpin-helix domain-containing protein [Enterococcus durans]MDT2835835.1 helix-hairpin-helix domain-containing protein [Enterococcus durans]
MKKIYQHIIDSPKLIISVLLSVALLFLGAGLLGGRIISQKDDGHVPLNLSVNSSNSSIVTEENMREEKKTYKETSKETIPVINYVDVKGAVNRPGIYSFSLGERVHDVIEKAGGVTDTADGNQINLAAKLTDQQLIYVPVIGEEIPEAAKGKQSHPVEKTEKNGQEEKINLNTADLAQLQQIPGIGNVKAQEIIRYREEKGSFQKIEELQEITGIGAKTVEQLRNWVTVTGE